MPADPRSLLGDWVLILPETAPRATLSIRTYTGIINANISPFYVSGKAQINKYSAGIVFSPDNTPIEQRRLAVGQITRTKMSGSPEAMRMEDDYLSKLQAVNRYELTNQNRLRLIYGLGDGVLIYQRQ